jgi:hypothetical protein
MRKSYIFPFIAVVFMASCNISGTSDAGKDSAMAVCIWDNTPLRDAPGKTAKWINGLSIGETVTYLNVTVADSADQKVLNYIKIRLKDGKEGWVQSDFVILNSKPAAIVENAELYSRPDLLNKTGKNFSQMDIVAVKSEQDGFVEVVGKRKGARWMESGWLRPSALTFDEVDIAVAKFAGKALEIADKNKKEEALQEIVNNPDLNHSIFISLIKPEEKLEVVIEEKLEEEKIF